MRHRGLFHGTDPYTDSRQGSNARWHALFRRTRAKFHGKKRHCKNKEGIRIETTCAVYQSNSRWRMVQGAVREAKTKHATAHTIATEKQGDEIINN